MISIWDAFKCNWPTACLFSLFRYLFILLVLLFVAYGFGYMWYKNKNIGCPKCEETNVSKDNENLKVHFDDFVVRLT